jgi:hypothetical protein
VSVLADVVPVPYIVNLFAANVAAEPVAHVSITLDVAVLQHVSFTAQHTVLGDITSETLMTAIIVAVHISVLAHVVSVHAKESLPADVAGCGSRTKVWSSRTWVVAECQLLSFVTCYALNSNAAIMRAIAIYADIVVARRVAREVPWKRIDFVLANVTFQARQRVKCAKHTRPLLAFCLVLQIVALGAS